jgi:two-component system response regulator PilR (NtrC family)
MTYPSSAPETLALLRAWRWPGNLRELANVLERAVTLCEGATIGPDLLPAPLREGGAGPGAGAVEAPTRLPPEGLDLQAHLDAIERRYLEQALARAGGVKTDAARLLALTFRSLRYRLAKFGIGG